MAEKAAKTSKSKKSTRNDKQVLRGDPGYDRAEALKNALADIEKNFGKGAVIKMGENSGNKNIPVITTGILSIDVALGVGGVPKGRIVEVYGPEASGKTTLALHIVAEAQKAGGIAGYIDAEHALDPVYAKNLGVNIDELYISQPDDGEQALEICEAMVRSAAMDIVVVDSVAALVPRVEIEGEMGASHMGIQARLMSQALRKLTAITNKTNCIVLFINQLRDKIGVTYGSSETTTGGRALKFYASIRIDVRRKESVKAGDEIIGSRTTVKIAKNKVAPPFKHCEADIMYGKGFSKEGDVLDLASDLNIMKKSGAWYSYGETRIGNGRENAKKFLKDSPEIYRELENAVRKHYDMPTLEEAAATAAEAAPKPVSDKELADDIELITDDLVLEADPDEESAYVSDADMETEFEFSDDE